ncbi:hypothetical protein SOP85_18310 [Pseudomonas sp. YuFO20]|uniref:hypothetical protein n=1 Tax=Pseudomonas sp. YuFO20 TaxID=3095362 RepID=UPI002B24D951|nr:hypothetical protein [Pseudomonas sp. YuFO20]MEB2517379.1 hypothetical protein [Pseudomonas sp. YuFO20]
MKNKTPFPTANHKDHFIYDNQPFINPEHGELYPIQWATVIDTTLIDSNDYDEDVYITPPSHYFQITPNGEIRGVTHDYDDHEEYFSVTADSSDVVFLKLFTNQYPHLTPTLSSLLHYRKDRTSKMREDYLKYKNNILKDD